MTPAPGGPAALPPGQSTPCLVVDTDVLDANLSRVHGRLVGQGLQVRPHAKTHKCLPIATRQLDGGAVGLTVATVGEAEVFATDGATDLFAAYPMWLDESRSRRIADLAGRCRLAIGVESTDGVRHLAERLDRRVELVVEVDTGHHRTGCAPEEAGRVAEAVRDHGLRFRGLFSFPGHSYAPGAAEQVARDEADALAVAVSSARTAGLVPEVVSGGSTPSAGYMRGGGPLTEARPGVYVFNDAQQWELDRCTPGDIALTAYGRVVSVRGRRAVLDAGSKVIAGDRAAYATGHGRLLDHPDARIVQLSEHHAVVELGADDRLSHGDLVRVVPNHVCTAVNLVDHLITVRDGTVHDHWPVAARGLNT